MAASPTESVDMVITVRCESFTILRWKSSHAQRLGVPCALMTR